MLLRIFFELIQLLHTAFVFLALNTSFIIFLVRFFPIYKVFPVVFKIMIKYFVFLTYI